MTRYYILKHSENDNLRTALRKYENGQHYVFHNKEWYARVFKFDITALYPESARKYKEILFERVYSVLPS